MDEAETQLETLQSNNTADATALAALEVALSTPATQSLGDQVLAAVVPVLEAAGWTAPTPVVPETPEQTETPAEDSTDTSVEA